ncbi:MAG: UDP-galactopyranose mutase [Roseiarcus sp.]
MGNAASHDAPEFLVVGAGLTGAVLARSLAEAGCRCEVWEESAQVGGHCATVRDAKTGILVHKHGPHTLHTDDETIWAFVERFATIHPYRHLKRARVGGELFPSPINLQTINQFFRTALGPKEAAALIAAEAAPHTKTSAPPANFEEAGLSRVGKRLYDAFYRGYTIKQWGIEPRELPASVFGRVPVRFDFSENYFHHTRQGQPVGGYSQLTAKILEHHNIHLRLNASFNLSDVANERRHIFYTGPLDRYFDFRFGRLPYRTLRFEHERGVGFKQGCAVINYCDESVSYTRVTEHKYFSGWERNEATLVTHEHSYDCGPNDPPYYPLRVTGDRKRLDEYVAAARRERCVSFLGRLGTYRYIDMDVAIREALSAATTTLSALKSGISPPPFFIEP